MPVNVNKGNCLYCKACGTHGASKLSALLEHALLSHQQRFSSRYVAGLPDDVLLSLFTPQAHCCPSQFAVTGVKRSRRTDCPKGFHKEDKDDAECAICHLYLHLSGLECDCCPGRRVCLQHADNLCECDPSRWRLVYRYSLQDLDSILERLSANIPQEGMWHSGPPELASRSLAPNTRPDYCITRPGRYAQDNMLCRANHCPVHDYHVSAEKRTTRVLIIISQ